MTDEKKDEEQKAPEKEEEKRSDERASEKDSGESKPSIEEALAEVERLKNINKEVIESRDKSKAKLRAIEEEKEKADAAEKAEQGKFQELYEAEQQKRLELESKVKNQAVDVAVRSALGEANAASVDTAFALINRDLVKVSEDGVVSPESVAEAVAAVKEQHDVLFTGPKKGPSVARAGEQKPSGGYQDELKKLQADPKATRQDLERLRAKYGRS